MRTGIADNIGSMIDVINTLRPTNFYEVFHYVGRDKAEYILSNDSDIFCGHSNFMNDKQESWQGCLVFLEHLKKVLSAKPYRVLETNLREISAIAKLTTSGYSYFMPYIMCVTPQKDSAYQWRNYTDKQKGGYCFGFNLKSLRDTIEQRNKKFNMYSSVFLAPCFYIGEDDALIESFMREFIGSVAKSELKTIEDRFKSAECTQAIIDTIGAIFTLAPLFKDKKWRREREWRLILKKAHVAVNQRYVRSHLSDICEHPFNLMSSITLSPHGDQAELLQYLYSKLSVANSIVLSSMVSKYIAEYYITPKEIDKDYEEDVLAKLEKDEAYSIVSQEEYRTEHPKETPRHA